MKMIISQKTDRYYTQGITIEYVSGWLKKIPIHKLLPGLKKGVSAYGITANHFGFTPTSIDDEQILYGDRPFSAVADIGLIKMSTDSLRKRNLSGGFYIGVIGPLAKGEEMQTGIHRWLNNKLPRGWNHQIKNDIVINYSLAYEKNWINKSGFNLNALGGFRIGTLNTNAYGGVNFLAGHFNPRYTGSRKRKVEYYFFGQGKVGVVGYDATLQGGLFNRSSEYTINAANFSRLVFQGDYGVALNFKHLYFTYSQAYLSREFKSGVRHRWGGVSVGVSL